MLESISATVRNWLGEMKIPTSKKIINQQLLSHTKYAPLLGIKDILNDLRIEKLSK